MKQFFTLPLIVVLAWSLGSCGGSNSTAGIEGTGSPVIATGAVTSFGSIYVNGERFDTRNAHVTLNGVAASEDDIQAGMVVEIHGTTDPDSGEILAEKVIYERSLLGKINAIERIETEVLLITLLGQSVYVAGDSVLESELDALAVGDTVEVSGFMTNEGLFESTRLVPADALSPSEVVGKVSQFDEANQSFHLHELIVDYRTATFSNGAIADLQNHAQVKVRGSLNGENILTATHISFQTRSIPENTTSILLEGIIDSYTDLSRFTLDNYIVDASGAILRGGHAEQLQTGVRVTIAGTVDGNGNLRAESLRLHINSRDKVRGTIEDIDIENQTLTILGTTFVLDEFTAFEDRSIRGNRFISLAELVVGDYVEVFGRNLDGELLAVRIKRLNSSGLVTINGPVNRVESNSLFYVMGVQVNGRDAEGAQLISSFTPGTRVQVEGVQTGSKAIQATRIQRLSECKKLAGHYDCDEPDDDDDDDDDGEDDDED